MITFDKALDTVMQLDYAAREELLKILEMRQIEERRKEIARNAKKTLADFKKGKLKGGTAAEVISQLNK